MKKFEYKIEIDFRENLGSRALEIKDEVEDWISSRIGEDLISIKVLAEMGVKNED